MADTAPTIELPLNSIEFNGVRIQLPAGATHSIDAEGQLILQFAQSGSAVVTRAAGETDAEGSGSGDRAAASRAGAGGGARDGSGAGAGADAGAGGAAAAPASPVASAAAPQDGSPARSLHLIPPLRVADLASPVGLFGLDIGGSLSKLAFLQPDEVEGQELDVFTSYILRHETYGKTGTRDAHLSFRSEALGGTFHFINFYSSAMAGAMQLVEEAKLVTPESKDLYATGGGAHKYSEMFEEQLQISFIKQDELDCLILGLNFLLNNYDDQAYYLKGTHYSSGEQPVRVPVPRGMVSGQPYLVVNIGSGVSIMHVASDNTYERVGGTSLGGGTFWGLCRLVTGAETFQDAMEQAARGDSTKCDMLVGDIYGGDYPKFGLSASTVASSFGKPVMKENPREGLEDDDIARSLIVMITQHLALVAHLNAQVHGIRKVVFAGSFLRHNPICLRTLAYALDYMSHGETQALFMTHEGYLGALGALLMCAAARNGMGEEAAQAASPGGTRDSSGPVPWGADATSLPLNFGQDAET